jgi:hypothetical protein
MEKQRHTLLWLALLAILVLVGALFAVWLRPSDVPPPTEENGPGRPFGLGPDATPTIYPSSETVIRSVQRLSRLETASYRIEKVITAESGQGPLGFLFGDRLLLIAHGEVIAGIDLSNLTMDSLRQTEDGVLYITLPPPEVFVSTLDNERTRVYDRRTGVVGMNVELETEARREAERLILEAAQEDGLEAEAADNAKVVLESFLLALGFEEVEFVDVLPTPAPTSAPTSTPSDPST